MGLWLVEKGNSTDALVTLGTSASVWSDYASAPSAAGDSGDDPAHPYKCVQIRYLVVCGPDKPSIDLPVRQISSWAISHSQ